MNSFSLKGYFSALLLMLLLVAAGCNNNKDTAGNANMFSGNGNKTWKATRETNAMGDKDKLTKEEKQERITFYSNNKFSMTSNTDQMNGTWNYDAANKNLALTFEGANVSENFKVENLSDSKMSLVAGDGSKMELKTE